MTSLKPGNLATIHNTVYRAKKRTNGCEGCDLNDFFRCPMIVDKRREEPKIDCLLHGVILKKV